MLSFSTCFPTVPVEPCWDNSFSEILAHLYVNMFLDLLFHYTMNFLPREPSAPSPCESFQVALLFLHANDIGLGFQNDSSAHLQGGIYFCDWFFFSGLPSLHDLTFYFLQHDFRSTSLPMISALILITFGNPCAFKYNILQHDIKQYNIILFYLLVLVEIEFTDMFITIITNLLLLHNTHDRNWCTKLLSLYRSLVRTLASNYWFEFKL